MSSVSTADTRVVFSEGQSGSPDIVLFQRLLLLTPSDANYQNIRLIPAGGKDAIRNFAKGYGAKNWVVIRDRDLDKLPDGAKLQSFTTKTKVTETVYLTGLTSIESYFLDSQLLHNFAVEERGAKVPDEASFYKSLSEAVAQLIGYQAIRWALQNVRQELRDNAEKHNLTRRAGIFDLPNRLTDTDGVLPKNLNEELCLTQAQEFVEKFLELTQYVSVEKLQTSFQDYQARFNAAGFLENEYRGWFHGKDIMTQWFQQEVVRRLSLSKNGYCIWAAQHLDFKQYPDLLEFQRICWYEE